MLFHSHLGIKKTLQPPFLWQNLTKISSEHPFRVKADGYGTTKNKKWKLFFSTNLYTKKVVFYVYGNAFNSIQEKKSNKSK